MDTFIEDAPRVVLRSFAWDEKIGRYRDIETGRVISRAQVRAFIEDSIGASVNHTNSLANLVSNGLMDVDAWNLAMREELKKEYIRQYLLGIGGKGTMTKSDWGKLGSMLKEQYHYLNGFADAVSAGDLTENQIRARSAMYVNSAREGFERANARAADRLGFDLVAWNLGTREEHCGDCVNFSSMGYQPVADDPFSGAFPGSGDTECLTGCGCYLSYQKSTGAGTY
jgi:hypothetical protein